MHRLLAGAAVALLLAATSGAAHAQLDRIAVGTGKNPISRDQPVTFTADKVEYDRDGGIVTASGAVEAWQNDHVIRADKMTFDRNTNVAAATGNVVLLEPDGQVLFSDYAELGEGMREGVLSGMRALLTENGRLAANGARRTGGNINELSKVVYSTCDLCKADPTRPPLWQIRALTAVQDNEHKRIEYYDAALDFAGLPVAYFPYFFHPDPSVKRASGLLLPSVGYSSHIGAFYAQPYYWVLDDQSDATITPMLTSGAGPNVDVEYRRKFNDGDLSVNGSAGYLYGKSDKGAQGSLFARGRFNLDDTWRYGFDIARASSSNYIRDFKLSHDIGGNPDVLLSQAYLEGFGQGAYARLDARGYQGLSSTIISSRLPLVLPRFEYSYLGRVDPLGGRLAVDTQDFNIIRSDGTDTRRGSLSLNWERPVRGQLGDLWKMTLHADAAAYHATKFNEQPNFGTKAEVGTTRALPQVALEARWPFERDGGAWGQQVIEPIAQVIGAPRAGNSQYRKIPNEDSLDLEFTDQNLFSLNRFPGIDRLEGGVRANVGLHTAWFLNGVAFDGLFGQSFRTERDTSLTAQSGLRNTTSDYVGRATITPADWLDLTYRTRIDRKTLQTRMADAVVSAGVPALRVSAGYIYTQYNPFTFYDQAPPPPPGNGYYFPRNEVSLGLATAYDRYKFNVSARHDIQANKLVSIGASASYEDECYILDLRLFQRYTQLNGDRGATTVLIQMTFKTVGQVGFRAL